MKANVRFFCFSFIMNLILGGIGFLITWGINALTDNSIIGMAILGVLFVFFNIMVNTTIVKKSKLKMGYSFFGIIINIVILAGLTALTLVL